ncbi:ATP-binding protein [Methyloligella sp. 2.7D]|uniref:ATP-binding protein n=1 Tax=unclassified Methyloligella TaxID=2625955 RepID=UPI00157D7B72|nr:ATP-binding protein [Methyloligella sp. GL2]QKP78512.1 hypothetical protein HT051_14325 [Methyloligella sp. GL2]
MDSFYDLGARLRAAFWLILAVALILSTLVAFTGVPAAYGFASFLIFIACVLAAPRNLPTRIEQKDRRRRPIQKSNADVSMRLVVEAFPDPAILLNRAGHVLFFNPAAQNAFASLREGGHISSVIRNPAFLDALSDAPERGRPITVTYAERVPVGRRMSVTVAPLARPNERVPSILVLLRDLTELERINQMRADFVANASHELRTPLASLRGFIETLQLSAKDDSGARERFLKVMAEQAARMTRLIDQLLSLSRAEMNVHVPPSNLVDLNVVIDHVRDAVEPLAQEHNATLEVQRFPSPALIRGDRDGLVQVLQNLIQNAFKYGGKEGVVKIETRYIQPNGRGNGRYSISVVDNGQGISAEHLPRLTERFYRVDVAYSRESGGTGLGLAIVKHIVNRHRGELAISSKPGEGSSFTVLFDAAERPEGALDATPEAAE